MRSPLRIAFATLLCVAAHAAAAAQLGPSPYLEPVPHHGACDVVVTPANAASELDYLSLNDPAKRVFCFTPGDYRAVGALLLTSSGTQQSRRYLRFHAQDGVPNASLRSERAVVEEVRITGSWWVIQGLTIQPVDPTTGFFLSVVFGGDHNILDGNLLDGADHLTASGQVAIGIMSYEGNAATFNSVQRNLVRNGNRSRAPVDHFGVLVTAGRAAGEDNDWNKVLDNEIADWGDGIAVGGYTPDCSEPGTPHGTLIDGNDVYITAAKRADCATGAPDPDGDCACAENGIDTKAPGDPDPSRWTRITNNRVWGYRPTADVSCGGSGSNGQAITAGNVCAGHTVVAKNVVLDSTIGINPIGPSWIIAGNLLAEIRVANGELYHSYAIPTSQSAYRLDIQFNTLVGVDNSYDDGAPATETRCNAVVDDNSLVGYGSIRGVNHVTENNFLYRSSSLNWTGASNAFYPTPEASGDTDLCFWRKRWSGPEQVCVELAAPTAASPHLYATAACDSGIARPFGIETVGYMQAAPEPGAALLGASGALALGALVRARSRRLSASAASAAAPSEVDAGSGSTSEASS
jgi:hypothetical protein